MSVCRKHLIPLHTRMWHQQAGASFYQISDESSSETDDETSDFHPHRRYSNASSIREKSTIDEEEEQ